MIYPKNKNNISIYYIEMPKKAKIPSYKVNVDKESHKENAKESTCRSIL